MLAPLENEFMLRAIAEVVLLGAAGAAVGCWVVLFRLSYAAESLAHSALPGVVLAALAGVPLIVGGVPAVLVAAGAIALASRAPGIEREVGVGVVVTTMFGLGGLLALSPASPPGLGELLFGDILGVTDGDLWTAAALVALSGAVLLALHGRLLAAGFDRDAAGRLGAAPGWAEAALFGLLALAIVVATAFS
jgi:ABC-type Mn2+/Zn2+ transport system permease subunit